MNVSSVSVKLNSQSRCRRNLGSAIYLQIWALSNSSRKRSAQSILGQKRGTSIGSRSYHSSSSSPEIEYALIKAKYRAKEKCDIDWCNTYQMIMFIPYDNCELGVAPSVCITSRLQCNGVDIGCTHYSCKIGVSFSSLGMEEIASCSIIVPINSKGRTVTSSIVIPCWSCSCRNWEKHKRF